MGNYWQCAAQLIHKQLLCDDLIAVFWGLMSFNFVLHLNLTPKNLDWLEKKQWWFVIQGPAILKVHSFLKQSLHNLQLTKLGGTLKPFQLRLARKVLVKVPPNWVNWRSYKHCFEKKWTLPDTFLFIPITIASKIA